MCTPSVPKYSIPLSRDFNKWLHTEQNEWIYTLKYVYIHPYVAVYLKSLKRQIFRNGGSKYFVHPLHASVLCCSNSDMFILHILWVYVQRYTISVFHLVEYTHYEATLEYGSCEVTASLAQNPVKVFSSSFWKIISSPPMSR